MIRLTVRVAVMGLLAVACSKPKAGETDLWQLAHDGCHQMAASTLLTVESEIGRPDRTPPLTNAEVDALSTWIYFCGEIQAPSDAGKHVSASVSQRMLVANRAAAWLRDSADGGVSVPKARALAYCALLLDLSDETMDQMRELPASSIAAPVESGPCQPSAASRWMAIVGPRSTAGSHMCPRPAAPDTTTKPRTEPPT